MAHGMSSRSTGPPQFADEASRAPVDAIFSSSFFLVAVCFPHMCDISFYEIPITE